MLQLKKNMPEFEVVDGKFKGHRYLHGVAYDPEKIPAGDEEKFEKLVRKKAPTQKTAPRKTEKK